MSLRLAVEMNESAKGMADTAREVQLQALDALVKSANTRDTRLAGFREVSVQMRRWSDELVTTLARLRTVCASFVTIESRWRTLERRRRLLQAAGVARARLGTFSRALQHGEDARTEQVRKATAVLDDLKQLGLMATVLSRTALIEAAGADAEALPALQEAASEFGRRATNVFDEGRRLASAARSAA